MKLPSISLKRTAIAAVLAGGAALAYAVNLPAQYSQRPDDQRPAAAETQTRNPSVAGWSADSSRPQLPSYPPTPPPSYAPATASGRPVTETRYETRSVQLPGGQVVQQMVPVTTTRMEPISALYEDPAIGELVRKYLEPPEDQRDPKLLEQLKEKLGEVFDRRHADQLAKLESAEKEIADIRHTLDKRASMKDELVERRVRELLDQPDPMNWNFQPRLGGASNHEPTHRFDGQGQVFSVSPVQVPSSNAAGPRHHFRDADGDRLPSLPSTDPPYPQPPTIYPGGTTLAPRSTFQPAGPTSNPYGVQPGMMPAGTAYSGVVSAESEAGLQAVIRLSYDLLTASGEYLAAEKLHERSAISDTEHRKQKNRFEMLKEMWVQKVGEIQRRISEIESETQELDKLSDTKSSILKLASERRSLQTQLDWMQNFAGENLQGVVPQEYTERSRPTEETAETAAREATEAMPKFDALDVDVQVAEEMAEVPATAPATEAVSAE